MGHYFIINDIYQKGYRTFISAIIMGDSNSGNIGICSSGSDRLLDESVWREAGFLVSLLFLILPVYYLSLADSFNDLLIAGLFRYWRSNILCRSYFFDKVLFKRSAWICQWDIRSRKHRNSVYFIWCADPCKPIGMGSYCQAFSHSADHIGCSQFLIGR